MYYYSAIENIFCLKQLKQRYVDAGHFPKDAIEVSEAIWLEFAGSSPPKGKERIAGENGLPAWQTIPPPSHAQLVGEAEKKKHKLLNTATAAIAPLQDAVDLKIATQVEIVQLKDWKEYRVKLHRLDTSQAPNIVWPNISTD